MIDEKVYMHDLAMLKLKNKNAGSLDCTKLFCAYMETIQKLKDAKAKYSKDHPEAFGGTSIGW